MCTHNQQRVLTAEYALALAPKLPLWTSHASCEDKAPMTQFHV